MSLVKIKFRTLQHVTECIYLSFTISRDGHINIKILKSIHDDHTNRNILKSVSAVCNIFIAITQSTHNVVKYFLVFFKRYHLHLSC